jgi:signal transduction histidine kinase
MQNNIEHLGHEPLTPEKKRRFIADAIHDLSNPITIMRLRLDLVRKSPDRLHEHLAAMDYQIECLEDLIKDML